MKAIDSAPLACERNQETAGMLSGLSYILFSANMHDILKKFIFCLSSQGNNLVGYGECIFL